MSTPAELTNAMLGVSRELQELMNEHPGLVEAETEANKLATLAEATIRIQQLAQDRLDGLKRTVQEYDAIVSKQCLDERYKADLAKGLRESNKLAINAAIERLRALTSLSYTTSQEMKLARVSDGP